MSRATTTTVCTALYAAALLCGYVGFKGWFYTALAETNLAHDIYVVLVLGLGIVSLGLAQLLRLVHRAANYAAR